MTRRRGGPADWTARSATRRWLNSGRWTSAGGRARSGPARGSRRSTKWCGPRPHGKRLLIEIKCGPEIIPALRKILDESGRNRRQFILQSFSLPTMKAVKRALPGIEAGWLCRLDQPTAPKAAAEADALIRRAAEAGMNGLHLRGSPFIDQRMVRKVKSARLKLRVWTVDSAPAARRLAALGIDGIITNRPGRLRARNDVLRRSYS